VALDGTAVADGEIAVTRARPVVLPATNAGERLGRALFATCVCLPLRGARRIRLLEDRVLVDRGEGFEPAFVLQRAGAVVLVV
jgi:hypothetical protein